MDNVTHMSPESLSATLANEFIGNHSVALASEFGLVAARELGSQKIKLQPLLARFSELATLSFDATQNLADRRPAEAEQALTTLQSSAPALKESLKKAGEEHEGALAVAKVYVDAGNMILNHFKDKAELSHAEIDALSKSLTTLFNTYDNAQLTGANIHKQQQQLDNIQNQAVKLRQVIAQQKK